MTIMRTKYFLLLLCLIGVSCTTSEEKISRKAERMHDSFLSIDTHSDTPMRLTRGGDLTRAFAMTVAVSIFRG